MHVTFFITLILSIGLGLVTPTHATATQLSTTAESLAAGGWAKLSNPPTNFFRQVNIAGDSTLSHMGQGTWDPVTRRVYFLGSPLGGISKLHVYDEATNSWQEGARIPGYPSNFGHGYNHNTLDPSSGTLSFIRLNSSRIDLYQFLIQQNISTSNTWQLVSSEPDDGDIAEALTYFPERGTWIMADGTWGNIREYNANTNTWHVLATNSSCFGETGVYHTFAVYLPLRGEVALGGGNTPTTFSHSWCTMDETGNLTPQPNAPTTLKIPIGNSPGALITVDPRGGDLLVLTDVGQMYAFDFVTHSWKLISSTGRPNFFNNTIKNVTDSFVVPISTHGVIMYGKTSGGNSEVWIYKHGGSGTSPQVLPLSVLKTGTGSGVVTSAPAGINCGNDCSSTYVPGTSVLLEANASSGTIFTGWSGGGCTGTASCIVPITQAKIVTATFTQENGSPPALTTPTPGATISGTSASFVWTTNGSNVTTWWLDIGSAQGLADVYQGHNLSASILSETIAGLPTNGSPIWVRLWYLNAQGWQFTDRQYMAGNA